MRRLIVALVALLLILQVPTLAVGTVTMSATTFSGVGVTRYTITWVSSAGGAVSANQSVLRNMVRGHLKQIRFVPDGGGTQPSDLYDVTLVDDQGIDLLAGEGANLSNALGSYVTWEPGSMFYDGTFSLDLVIANAGNAKGGVITLWVGP